MCYVKEFGPNSEGCGKVFRGGGNYSSFAHHLFNWVGEEGLISITLKNRAPRTEQFSRNDPVRSPPTGEDISPQVSHLKPLWAQPKAPTPTSHVAEVGCCTSCGCQEVAPSPQCVPSTQLPELETLPRVLSCIGKDQRGKKRWVRKRRGRGQGTGVRSGLDARYKDS